MKAILVVLSIFLILGCKSKKVLKTKASELETVQIISEKKEEKQVEKNEQRQDLKKSDLVDQKKESQTEVEIKGKAETDKPIELYNIENGDTLQTIKVTGNADVSIRTKTNNSNQVKKENSTSESTNKLEEFAKKIVNEDNLKKTGKDIKNSAKEVTTTTGTFWSFGLILGLGIVTLIIIGLIIYFKK
jgi:tetrahydromethanopterin S-methyltransferase subunit B